MIICGYTDIIYLLPLGRPLESHLAIPQEDLEWLNDFMIEEANSHKAAILMLRRKLFPSMHNPYLWVEGKQ